MRRLKMNYVTLWQKLAMVAAQGSYDNYICSYFIRYEKAKLCTKAKLNLK